MYCVEFLIYNNANKCYFQTCSQYVNWIAVMRKNFNEHFTVISIETIY